MSQIQNIQAIVEQQEAGKNESVSKKEIEKSLLQKQVEQNAMMWAFFQILECSEVQQQIGITQAKILEANSQDQAKLNNAQAAFNFIQMGWSMMYTRKQFEGKINIFSFLRMVQKYKSSKWNATDLRNLKEFLAGKANHLTLTFKKTVKYTQLHNLQVANQQIDMDRSFITNQVALDQQSSQIIDGEFNSTIDNESATLQIGSSLTQMIQTLTSQINSANH